MNINKNNSKKSKYIIIFFLNAKTFLVHLLRTTDPIHFYKSDYYENLLKLELLKIHQNQSKKLHRNRIRFLVGSISKMYYIYISIEHD